MPIDVSKLNASQIVGLLAVAATCFAAILAVVGALVVAVVNSRSARRVARETAQREFRLNGVRPYLDFLDRRISLYDDMARVGPDLSSALQKLVALLTSEHERAMQEPQTERRLEPPRDLQESMQLLNEIQTKLGELRTIFRDTGLFAFILSDQKVLYKTHQWLDTDRAFLEVVVASGGITTAPEQLRKIKECASAAFKRAVELRMAIEEFIFGNRGWLRRGSYLMWAKSRAAWEKLISNRESKT
jgi:hypothetical protein